MKQNKLLKIFNRLQKGRYKVHGPVLQDEETQILELENLPDLKLLEKVSDRPYKYFLMPMREMLYKYDGRGPKVLAHHNSRHALFGMSIYDIKALELYDRVFQNDTYYRQGRKKLLIIGYSAKQLSSHKTTFFELDNKVLESCVFDIFIEKSDPPASSSRAKSRDLTFYARGTEGKRILRDCGIKFKEVKYKAKKEDKNVLKIKKAMEQSQNDKMWEELGKICLACGKCTIACPTCFCFDIESVIGPEKKAERTSGNCFFDDFTRIAGGHKFLNNPAEKIKFWYYHKFVRIPRDYGLPGCVDCGRCTKVCPVGIDIEKNIKRLLKQPKVKSQKLKVNVSLCDRLL
ncbi:4Fe-4S dicluster domain-containing protein [Patescibacteria group bacterium]